MTVAIAPRAGVAAPPLAAGPVRARARKAAVVET